MDWLTEVIKQLQTSRAFVTAVFVVCLCILLGHNFAPALIPQVPADWKLPLIGSLLFSGTLLAFIIIPYVWTFFSKGINDKTKEIKSSYLSEDERVLLYSLALTIEDNKDDFVNLSNIDYYTTNFSKLEFQEIVVKLEEKGLVELNPFAPNLISLSATGRRRAIEMRRNKIAGQVDEEI